MFCFFAGVFLGLAGFLASLALGVLCFFDAGFLVDDALAPFVLVALAGVSGFAGEVAAGAGVVAAGAGVVAAGVSAFALGALLVAFGLGAAFGLAVLGLVDLDLEFDYE